MFLSKSSSSTLAVAMFHNQYKVTIDNSRERSNQMMNQNMLNFNKQYEVQKHQSVQSMSVT